MNRFKKTILTAIFTAVIAAGAVFGFTGVAGAATNVSKAATYGDCRLYTSVTSDAWGTGHVYRGNGVISCTKYHTVSLTTSLKIDLGAAGTWQQSLNNVTTPGINGFVVTSGGFYVPKGECHYYQSGVNASISGIGSVFLSSGSPVPICG